MLHLSQISFCLERFYVVSYFQNDADVIEVIISILRHLDKFRILTILILSTMVFPLIARR